MSEQRSIGPFTIDKQIGAGGMGVVYLATYKKTQQKVALKVLAPDLSADQNLLARFEREIEILKKLRHPNVVRYYGGGKHENQRFYAMEIVTGGSLEEMLEKRGKLAWEDTITFSRQICDALHYAHQAGVVHRDLKPANLLLAKSGKIKLTDFGIARDSSRTALTAAGKTVGTYAYMAPEQISGKTPISRKTDLYALGCVMFEFLTGRTPFESESAPETLFKHMEEDPPLVRELVMECPIWLERLVDQLLSKDPEDRPYDALAVQMSLDEVVQKVADRATISTVTSADQETAKKKRRKRKKKRREAATPFYERTWFLVSSLVAVAAFVTWMMWPLNEDQLIAKAEKQLANVEELYQKKDVMRKYLLPLLEKYPEGEHAEKAKQLVDDIEMEEAESDIEGRIRRNREAKSESERLYREAKRFEAFGDRLTALEKYRGLVTLQKDDEKSRPVVNLARREIARLEKQSSKSSDRAAFLNQQLHEADKLHNDGQLAAAKRKWESLLALYAGNQEFEPQVEQARARLKGDFTSTIGSDSEQD